MTTAADLIAHFDMTVLPAEGGIFAETYRAERTLPSGQPFSTAILYLLTNEPDSFSALHRLPTDEIFHYHLGGPADMLLLYPDGRSQTVTLGPDVLNGQHVQFVVPAGVWQGTRLRPGADFVLLGTTMAPGFTQADYQGGQRDALVQQYPQARAQIEQLTRPDAPSHMPT